MTSGNMAGSKFKSGTITRIGVLGAIAAVLFYFPEIPMIGFLKLDFSTLPALLGGFAMGPLAGLIIVAIKDLVGLTHSTSMMVGEIADFLMSGAFVLVASLCYSQTRTRRSALIGMGLGVVAMTVVGTLTNYFLLIPFYINVMGFAEEMVIGMMAKVIPAIDSMSKVIALAIVPFNIVKGLILSLITLLMYKPLSPLLKGKKE